ncbi:globin domain-containing protein [Larsenimonas suaedae]|uniref:nitric oxide dioxygenase n=1 Tax=Larsenimonas suaedae TaxID=1851019 RepID=A0ABU1GXL5_9GAMM|nr:globin domain-containing protein [Larsenimonas suaedae]MCM2973389.1 globin domain-containing protein [Larsenimonas suaedae]MDR5896282.1 globin domain-containing protein [Larsenimonas suaedae]
MITLAQRQIIADTAPVVAQHITTITTRFYPMMFARYPEIAPLFNPRHQQTGAQPRALGNSIVSYVMNYEDNEALDGILGTIAHKHAALQIEPEHYRIVGECLLETAGEVLGEAFTPEVEDAWGALYWAMANDLIAREERIYHDNDIKRGGWRGWRPFVLSERIEEDEGVVSLRFTPHDDKPIAAFEAGQYLGLRLTLEGTRLYRQYSLTGPVDAPYYQITVKKESLGKASRYLDDEMAVGDTLHLCPPIGLLTLDRRTAPVALVSAGIGQTPMITLARQALAQGRQVSYLHGATHPEHCPFKNELEALKTRYPGQLEVHYRFSQAPDGAPEKGHIDRSTLSDLLPLAAQPTCYFTGPNAFMIDVEHTLDALGVPEARRHYECFGPLNDQTT